jgi:hypothetical protein
VNGSLFVHMTKKRSTAILRICCCLAFVSTALAQSATEMPTTEGDSLAGHKVVLPGAAAGKVAVLVFGFTKASKVQTSAWASKLQADFRTRPDFEFYQLPVLEDVPRFVRGMVIFGMRKGVAEDKRDHFVPILQGEAELKKFVHYKEPDDAYLVVLDRAGKILQQSHGSPDDASYARLRIDIESALNQK